MTSSLEVLRVIGSDLVTVGIITYVERGAQERFAYVNSYLERDGAIPLSRSLPLSTKVYDSEEMRPYFEGLLPEGPAREALAVQLGIPANRYLELLAEVGLDCIGDVVVRPMSSAASPTAWDRGTYMPLTRSELEKTLGDLASLASSNEQSRLSLAGTQGKVGLAHLPGAPMDEGWLRPLYGAASTHIIKTSNISRVAEFEVICLEAARLCGIKSARLNVLSMGRTVACVERFDRLVGMSEEGLHVTRLHQEDMAQAFGIDSWSKYSELEGGTYRSIARLLEDQSLDPMADIEELAKLAVFDYLVGNCDNHLKNLALVYQGKALRLAPAYDIVCTTYFERFSREMGRRLGSTRLIDEVEPSDFAMLARDLGRGARRMRTICADLAERFGGALLQAGDAGAEVLSYDAEDLLADAAPRLSVVEKV